MHSGTDLSESFLFFLWTQEAEPTHVTTLYNLAGLLKNKKQVTGVP